MAHPSTLYRFRIELSDVDRGVYETLDFRVAMHPSETPAFLLTRVIAYALNFGDGLEFAPGGLSDPDAPALRALEPHGATRLWIEIGNPSARKLHKASKAAREVKVYTYKDPELLLKEIASEKVHQASRIEIRSLPQSLLNELAQTLQRDNQWTLVHTDGSLMIGIGERSLQAELGRHSAT